MSDTCVQKGIALVAVQIALCVLSVSVTAKWPESFVPRRWQHSMLSLAFAAVLLFSGVFILTKHPSLGFTLFTLGACVLSAVSFPRETSGTLLRALSIACAVLLLASVVGLFTDFYRGWAGWLLFCLCTLLIVLLGSILTGAYGSKLNAFISAFGASLFAIYTVHDIVNSPCRHPAELSVRVFLDLMNLFLFSRGV